MLPVCDHKFDLQSWSQPCLLSNLFRCMARVNSTLEKKTWFSNMVWFEWWKISSGCLFGTSCFRCLSMMSSTSLSFLEGTSTAYFVSCWDIDTTRPVRGPSKNELQSTHSGKCSLFLGPCSIRENNYSQIWQRILTAVSLRLSPLDFSKLLNKFSKPVIFYI